MVPTVHWVRCGSFVGGIFNSGGCIGKMNGLCVSVECRSLFS